MSLRAERSVEMSALPVDPDLGDRGNAVGRRQGAQRTILLVVAIAGAAGALARYSYGDSDTLRITGRHARTLRS